VNFTVNYDFPGPVTITGVELREAAPGENGPVVMRANVSEAIVSATGDGTISLDVPVTTPEDISALTRLLTNATGFYVNLRTSTHPNGALRAQLSSLSFPPVIKRGYNRAFLLTAAPLHVKVSVPPLDFDLNTISAVIDGRPVPGTPHPQSGEFVVEVPASMMAKPGVLALQLKNAQGLLSEPNNFVVAARQNETNAVGVDAARFRRLVARDGICAVFGSGFSTNTVTASSTPLPDSLDGTSVYVNGRRAPLFFVSPAQVNFQMPFDTYNGFWGHFNIMVVAKDGTVTYGWTFMADTAPAIFTRLGNGQGAPAALASADGVKFNIEVSNSDGSPTVIDAGSYVSLYGTGIRHASGPVSVSVGGTSVSTLFAGPHGTYPGLDQVNIQIPTSLAGRGDVELVIHADGQASNPVKLNIR
jgi:uncharacterized protein (TIGR03437 family)